MDVYADLYFLINFSMDYLCLWLAARVLRRPLSLGRGFLASALGGIYAVCALFITVPFVWGLLLDAMCCILLCSVAFFNRREKFRVCLQLSGLYFLVSVLLGGVMTVLYAQLNRIPGFLDKVEEDGLSAWLFFLLACLSALFSRLFTKISARRAAHRPVRIEIVSESASVCLSGICDSGNLLCDPLTGKPVIPVERSRLRGILPADVLRAAAADDPAGAMASLPVETVRRLRLRLLPVRTANGETLQFGWVPQAVFLLDETGKHPLDAVLCPLSLISRTGGTNPEVLLPAAPASLQKQRKVD